MPPLQGQADAARGEAAVPSFAEGRAPGSTAGLAADTLERARGTVGDTARQLQLPTPLLANAPSTQAPRTCADDIDGRLHFGTCQRPASPTPLASPRVQRPTLGTKAPEIPAWADAD